MTIKLDSTRHSVVVICTDCPWWRGFGFDTLDAWGVGRAHEQRVHKGELQAAKALANARKKADDTP